MKKIINNKLVDMTNDEITQREIDIANAQQEKNEIEQEKQDAITKKASGKQKLLDLGLTEEEVKALIGI